MRAHYTYLIYITYEELNALSNMFLIFLQATA
jgi:hypothetical protein